MLPWCFRMKTTKEKIQVLIELVYKKKFVKYGDHGNFKKIHNKPKKENFTRYVWYEGTASQ